MKKEIKYSLIVLGVITSIFFVFYLRSHITYEEFSSEKWKNWIETENTSSLRWDMMNSLRNNHELKGKTKQEIIELLGEPNEDKTNVSFRYYLGMAKHGIDTGSLVIKFDEKDIVVSYYVWHG